MHGGTPGAPGGQVDRRAFVKILGTAVAAASLEGCFEPPEDVILPYVRQPPEVVPGEPRSYATARVHEGYATGLLVQTREGRPIKVEGNPGHPASLGGTDVHDQAYLLQLYDPSREGRIVAPGGAPASRRRMLLELVRRSGSDGGRGLHLLVEPTSSPTRIELLERFGDRFPAASVHVHAPVGPSSALRAYLRTTGRPLLPRYRLDRARVVVSFDADFASVMPFHLRYARDFADRRRLDAPDDETNRLYAAEAHPGTLAPVADHHFPVRSGDVVFLLAELVRALGGGAEGLPPTPARLDAERVRRWVRGAAADLRANPGEGVVMAGDHQPPAAHALAHRANALVNAFGRTVVLQETALDRPEAIEGGLDELADAVRAGAVETLVVLEGNPAYSAPADLDFAALLREVPETAYLGMYRNETAERSGWFLPSHHPMEAWGDARAFDGTVTPIQPLVRPLYEGASTVYRGATPERILLDYLDRPEVSVRDAVEEVWRSSGFAPPAEEEFRAFREDALRRGMVEGTALPEVSPPSLDDVGALLAEVPPPTEGLELSFRPHPRVHDGRFANNAWLQELPDPTTKLTWSNAALLSPATARALGVEAGDPLALRRAGRQVTAPALPVPGHADGSITLHLGYGREGGEAVARGLGANAYRLRTADAPWTAAVEAGPTGGPRVALAVSQPEWRLHDREAVLHRTLEELRADPDFAEDHRGQVPALYEPPEIRPAEQQWGMTIDLSLCTGCGACVVACQAENNVPVVGPEDVRRGRIMHWIRIDRYVEGPEDDPDAHLRQPMLCQHCEKAPCEYVCPVNATVHSADGLNEMIYNRCIGTRFCSNNCPYKVRRFNWFDYNDRREPPEPLVLNPDVTVRERGVMEKCTYCVQRIRRTQNRARAEGRPVGPDEVVPACAQACPTRAIVFGDLTGESEARRMRDDPRAYQVLHELGTRPRTSYLARISNPGADDGSEG